MDSIIPGLVIALLTIFVTHSLQTRREKENLISSRKEKGVQAVIESCKAVLDDTTRLVDAYRTGDQKAIAEAKDDMPRQGTAITAAKAGALMVHDKEIRELAYNFLLIAGDTRSEVTKAGKYTNTASKQIQHLNNAFGDVCDKSREYLYS